MRAGTENTAGIVGLGEAAAIAQAELATEWERLSELRDWLVAEIKTIPRCWINGDEEYRLPGNVNFGVEGIAQDTLLIRLDMVGFAVSAGSACSAGSLTPSHVLTAMGQPADKAGSAIRVTLGRYTTEDMLRRFVEALKTAVASIRKPSV